MKHDGNCFTVVVDPQSPKTLWAATGRWETNAGCLCRSDDDGQTWQVVGSPQSGLPDGQIKYLALDLHSPVGRRRLLATSNAHGVYQSLDGGTTWNAINGNLPADTAPSPRGLLLDGATPDHMIVALGGTPKRARGFTTPATAARLGCGSTSNRCLPTSPAWPSTHGTSPGSI